VREEEGKIKQLLREEPEGTPPELEEMVGTFDLIHIDGDHTYRGAEVDTE